MTLCTYGPPFERERKWLLTFDDPAQGIAIYDNEGEAMRAWDRAKDNWTCTLWVIADFVKPEHWTTELQLATNGN